MFVGFFNHRPKISGQCPLLEGEGGEGVWQHPHDDPHEQDRPGPHQSGQQVSPEIFFSSEIFL